MKKTFIIVIIVTIIFIIFRFINNITVNLTNQHPSAKGLKFLNNYHKKKRVKKRKIVDKVVLSTLI